MTKTIRMVREGPEPCTADVHPAEVENFRAAGFMEADPSDVKISGTVSAESAPDPLDHDGDGEPGGSVKGFHATAAKGARKRKGKA